MTLLNRRHSKWQTNPGVVTMNRNYTRPTVDPRWYDTRCTDLIVATAIHAIADSKRSADEIWDAPTQAEEDHVHMAVEEYLSHGDFEPSDDDRYCWGVSKITVPL